MSPYCDVAQRLDALGQVHASDQYDAWGARTAGGALHDPVGYRGQFGYYTDEETGLLLCTWRYYDPQVGRWLTRDPIGAAGGLNLYAYCGGNPVSFIDPLGTNAVTDWYLGGMGGVSEWTDQWVMGGQTERFGNVQGLYDSGKATLGQVAWEGGIWGAEVIATAADAFVAGKAVSGLRVVSGIAEAQSWKGVRAMLGRQGVAEPGQWVHHWGIEQAETRGNALFTWFSNQPWNLVPLDVGKAAEFTEAGKNAAQGFSRLSHLVHGHKLSTGLKWGVARRFWFGTPS